jgi:hypothetical protein
VDQLPIGRHCRPNYFTWDAREFRDDLVQFPGQSPLAPSEIDEGLDRKHETWIIDKKSMRQGRGQSR